MLNHSGISEQKHWSLNANLREQMGGWKFATTTSDNPLPYHHLYVMLS